MAAPSEHAYYEQLREEHRELHEALQTIDRELRSVQRTQQAVDSLIWRFAELIESHFSHEEDGGYMQDAIQRAPRLANRASRLLRQHTELLEEATKLQMLARSGLESAAWWQQIELDFGRLRDRLLDHEHKENALVQEAFNRDIAASD